MNVPWSHRGSLMLMLVDNSPVMVELVHCGQIHEMVVLITKLLPVINGKIMELTHFG